jgi:DNA (cytosine-5)-methyltransferase 1
MVENQSTIFEMLYQTFKITKPIRLITLFSGYDSQALALKYLGVDFELYKTCEWAIKSIQALKDLHFGEDTKDYSKDLETSQIKEFLLNKGISSNYNEPMNKSQINRLSEKQARNIYNNIKASHNLVNIQQVKGKDLEIVDTNKYTYIMTYSFPCQDLSLAGNRALMSDTSTRSGMLWEVERILSELEEKPQVLLMENVPQVHGEGAKEDFNKWQLRLEELGYKNYWKDLIATDYGIPQTRNRCFMVSILGDYNYTFPKPIPLRLKLKDMLEDNVPEKYYLSEKMIEFFTKNEEKQKENGNGFRFNVSDGNVIAKTITTLAGNRMDDNFIKIKNATQKGYLEATEGDGIDISNGSNDRGAVINPLKGISGKSWQFEQQVYDENGSARTLKASEGSGNIPKVINDLRIRKLTPKECFRLMGVKDEDFEKVAKNQSDSSLYHLAGDSIVVNVLMAIFKEML